jgi:hypothetical protein
LVILFAFYIIIKGSHTILGSAGACVTDDGLGVVAVAWVQETPHFAFDLSNYFLFNI